MKIELQKSILDKIKPLTNFNFTEVVKVPIVEEVLWMERKQNELEIDD